MPVSKTQKVKQRVDRRTFLIGSFRGRFVGYVDPIVTDSGHETIFNIEVIEGEITVHASNVLRWELGEPQEYHDPVAQAIKLPDSLVCVLHDNGSVHRFVVNLNNPRLFNFKLVNQIYDGNQVFGEIVGSISGYLVHYDEVYVEVISTTDNPKKSVERTLRRTGNQTREGRYTRTEHTKSDGGTYWGEWIYNNQKKGISLHSIVAGIMRALLFILAIAFLIVIGWRAIGFVLLMCIPWILLYLVPTLVGFIYRKFFSLVTMGLVLMLVWNLVLPGTFRNWQESKRSGKPQASNERSTRRVNSKKDSLIVHHLAWKDYEDQQYSTNLIIPVRDVRAAASNRTLLPTNNQQEIEYNAVLASMYEHDRDRLAPFYYVFDSIQAANQLNEQRFAEMITSCIQSIPYTLILPYACQPELYNDQFITNYLQSGRACRGNTRFGIFSPMEFAGSLEGDCDTRTLLLFTLLEHYGYDMAVFGSTKYSHSLLGINLPLNGEYKLEQGRRFVLWETTSEGYRPGTIPIEISDMNHWSVNLIKSFESL
jgi:hypothetical protein